MTIYIVRNAGGAWQLVEAEERADIPLPVNTEIAAAGLPEAAQLMQKCQTSSYIGFERMPKRVNLVLHTIKILAVPHSDIETWFSRLGAVKDWEIKSSVFVTCPGKDQTLGQSRKE